VPFISIQDYYAQMKTEPGRMDPFIKSLLEGLCLIERDYSREALSEISADLIKDGISDRCYGYCRFLFESLRYMKALVHSGVNWNVCLQKLSIIP